MIVLKLETFGCIPIFIFAFSCHQNLFALYKDINANYLNGPLDSKKLHHIYTVIDLSILGAGVFYCLIGVAGYVTLGPATRMIVLDNCITN